MVKALAFMHSKNVLLLINFKGCSQRYKAWEYASLQGRFKSQCWAVWKLIKEI